MEPKNKGRVGDNINSAVLSSIERLSSFSGPQCIKNVPGPQAMSFIERFVIQCPYYRGSTIGGRVLLRMI